MVLDTLPAASYVDITARSVGTFTCNGREAAAAKCAVVSITARHSLLPNSFTFWEASVLKRNLGSVSVWTERALSCAGPPCSFQAMMRGRSQRERKANLNNHTKPLPFQKQSTRNLPLFFDFTLQSHRRQASSASSAMILTSQRLSDFYLSRCSICNTICFPAA